MCVHFGKVLLLEVTSYTLHTLTKQEHQEHRMCRLQEH